MQPKEIATTFTVENDTLIGIVHAPETPQKTGLLCVIAGGPQYRVGCCRQQVTLARRLAADGIPVMRFDFRGMGDSEGDFPDLERTDDINAAIEAFKAAVPELQQVALYGGCDGASSIAISSWNNPAVGAWVLNNPYTKVEAAEAQVRLKHYYLERLTSPELWRKLLRFEFQFGESFKSLLETLKSARGTKEQSKEQSDNDPFDTSIPFTQRMLLGWKRFDKQVLLLMAEHSLVAKEFDQCVAASEAWQSVVHQPKVERVDLEGAFHTFSDPQSQDKLYQVLTRWLRDL